jgi:hypothetical protein
LSAGFDGFFDNFSHARFSTVHLPMEIG